MLIALLRAFAPDAATADVRALLVGVSKYDDSLPIADLAGPPNDVRLMASVLRRRGVDDIAILADGVVGAARPTHAAILAAFDALAEKAGPGDLALVHFSGHGTQQIDQDGDEADGLDEVFLPADAAPGPAGSGRIDQALVDDEIGRRLARIRAAGADVWLVMDSCHSGSGMRAIGDGAVARFVAPEVFGIDTGAAAAAATREPAGTAPVERAGDPALPGGLIAFYAAQANELAYEVQLGEAGAPASYGLFSAKLAARLEAGEPMSYRQLFQAVLSDINAAPGSISLRSQTPLWEGSLGDAPVLGATGGAGVTQFAVANGKVQAGAVHGLAAGTLLALVADAAAGEGDVLGTAQMVEVGPISAGLRAVATSCVPKTAALCAEIGPVPEGARFARLVAKPVDRFLHLAPPRDLATGAVVPDDNPLVAALIEAVAEVNAAGAMQVVLDEDDNTVETALADGALWFGSPVRIGEGPAGLRWDPGDAPLGELLTRIARAEQSAAMLGAIASTGSVLNRNPVEFAARVRHVAAEALAHPGDFASIFEECGAALAAAGGPVALDPAARLKPCEQIVVSAKAGRDATYDLNRVHIDAQYCVSVAYERIAGRRPATGKVTEDITLCNDYCPSGPVPGGQERLYLLVTAARDHAEPLNLTGLLETCAPGAQGDGARDIGGPAGAFLAELANGTATRSASLRGERKKVWVEAFRWWNLPRAELAEGAR